MQSVLRDVQREGSAVERERRTGVSLVVSGAVIRDATRCASGVDPRRDVEHVLVALDPRETHRVAATVLGRQDVAQTERDRLGHLVQTTDPREARLDVQCFPGGEIEIQGERQAEGRTLRRILKVVPPDEYDVACGQDGYMTERETARVLPGRTALVDLDLSELGHLHYLSKRWAAWERERNASLRLTLGGLRTGLARIGGKEFSTSSVEWLGLHVRGPLHWGEGADARPTQAGVDARLALGGGLGHKVEADPLNVTVHGGAFVRFSDEGRTSLLEVRPRLEFANLGANLPSDDDGDRAVVRQTAPTREGVATLALQLPVAFRAATWLELQGSWAWAWWWGVKASDADFRYGDSGEHTEEVAASGHLLGLRATLDLRYAQWPSRLFPLLAYGEVRWAPADDPNLLEGHAGLQVGWTP